MGGARFALLHLDRISTLSSPLGRPELLFFKGANVGLLKGPTLLGARLLGLHLFGPSLAATFKRLSLFGRPAELHRMTHVLLLAFLTGLAFFNTAKANQLVGPQPHAAKLLGALMMQISRILETGVDEKARVTPVLHHLKRLVDALLLRLARPVGRLGILNRLQSRLRRPTLGECAVYEHLLSRLHPNFKRGLLRGRSGCGGEQRKRRKGQKKKGARPLH